MAIEILEGPVTRETLTDHASVSIAFEVRTILHLEDAGLGGLTLVERAVEAPWTKDYDTEADNGPERWADGFDVSNWGMLAAREGGERVGGAVLAWRTEGCDMLKRRDDLAVVWDLRVAPEHRGRGIGTRLWDAAVAWARARGCRDVEVETQNVNVPACRFYEARGCVLASVSRFAYPECPDEIMMIWHLSLET